MTYRAVRVLQEVDLILCENQKNSLKLLNHFGIKIPAKTLYKNNTDDNSLGWIYRELKSGKNLAYISDAGTPGVSDPGSVLVKYLRDCDVDIVPIPGASALSTLLSVSGAQANPSVFLGFLPPKEGKKRKLLEGYQKEELVLVCFESVHRVEATLSLIREIFPLSEILVGREMTKVHEEYIFIPSGDEPGKFTTKGEFAILVNNRVKKITKGRKLKTDIQKKER